MPRKTIPDVETLRAELERLTDRETVFAMDAVARDREQAAADVLLEGMTVRELLIARLAWQRGHAEVVHRIADVMGPAAATLDADAMRRALRDLPRTPHFEPTVTAVFRDNRERELARDVRELDGGQA